jgi:hypothetical protein
VLAVLMVATLVVAGCDRGSQTPEGGELAETPSPWPDDDATSAAVAPRGDTASPGPSTPSKAATPGGDADQAAGRKVPEAGEPPPLDGLYSDDELEVARTMADYYAWLMAHPNTDPELVDKIFDDPRESGYRPSRLEVAREKVTQFREHQWWWTSDRETRIVNVEVLDEKASNVRVVRIYYHRPTQARLIDAKGNVHERLPAGRPFEEEIWGRDDGDSPWQVISILNTGQWEKGDL